MEENNNKTEAKNINNYNAYWATTDINESAKKFDSMWDYIPTDFDSVLDLGGGIGAMYTSLSKKGGASKKYHLMESSAVAVDMAKSLGIEATVFDFDTRPLPFESQSFDLVVLSDVLEHMNNPWALLAEASRISKKYVFVHGPNFAALQCRLDALTGNPIRQMVAHKNGSLVDPAGRKANHIYYMTYNNLIYWGNRAGLGVHKSRVFWYRRYAPFRFFLERFFKNFGELYDVVFIKKGTVAADKNFVFYE